MALPELSIGITTCGRPKVLKRCLTSLERFVKVPYKLIILDNTKAFTNAVDMSWAKKKADIYLEIADRKIGCCESNNLIADACDTEFLMHIDDDVYFKEPGIVETLLGFVKEQEKLTIASAAWYDNYYKSFRHAAMKYIFGIQNGKLCVKKYPIPFEFAKTFKMDFVETDECLHSMVLPMEVYKHVRWDNNFAWKGDRLDFFLQCKFKGIKCYMYTRQYVIHDPRPFPYGSLSYEFDGRKAIEYFWNKWKIWPIVGWDKYQDKPR